MTLYRFLFFHKLNLFGSRFLSWFCVWLLPLTLGFPLNKPYFALIVGIGFVTWPWFLKKREFFKALHHQFPQLQFGLTCLTEPKSELEHLLKKQLEKALKEVRPKIQIGKTNQWLAILLTSLLFGLQNPNRTSENQLNTLNEPLITIQPPAYTKYPAWQQSWENLEVIEGSLVKFLNSPPICFQSLDEKQILDTKNGMITIEDGLLTAEGFKTISLKCVRDLAPKIKTVEPKQSFQVISEVKTVTFIFEVYEDFGLSQLKLEGVIFTGSGEVIEGQKHSWNLEIPNGNKVKMELDLSSIGWQPSKELAIRLVAWDNKPEPNVGQSPLMVLRWPEKGSDSDFSASLQVEHLEERFRSQRQIIIDTEALIAQNLTQRKQRPQAQSLAIEQKQLRLRYGAFLGEEASELESAPQHHEAEHEGHEHDEPNGEHNENDHHHGEGSQETHLAEDPQQAILEQFGHSHDSAEHATLFDPKTKATLKQALAAMWESELELRLNRPELSLVHQYEALSFIQKLRYAERIYLKRVGLEIPPLDFERRLTGEEKDMVSQFKSSKPSKEPVQNWSWFLTEPNPKNLKKLWEQIPEHAKTVELQHLMDQAAKNKQAMKELQVWVYQKLVEPPAGGLKGRSVWQ